MTFKPGDNVVYYNYEGRKSDTRIERSCTIVAYMEHLGKYLVITKDGLGRAQGKRLVLGKYLRFEV
jgi:hypothetical protein